METKRKRKDPVEVGVSKGVELVGNNAPREGHYSGSRPTQDSSGRYVLVWIVTKQTLHHEREEK